MSETIDRESSLALGHYLTLQRPPAYDAESELRFQNFWINETARFRDPVLGVDQEHLFLPFGFSGISVNRSGDNVDASLVFPKNTLSESFSDAAVQEGWSVVVAVVWIKNLTDSQQTPEVLHRYEGQVSSATWDDTTVTLTCNSILDAVEANVPARALQQLFVGNVPFTGQLSLK